MEQWIRVEERRGAGETTPASTGRAGTTPGVGTSRSASKPSIPPEVAAEIRNAAVGATARQKERLVEKMTDAVAAYDRNRFQEAVRLGRQVANEAPSVAAVRELVGLAAYRNGQWTEARRQLEAYRDLTGMYDHIPELMDTLRALGRAKRVAELWHELRRQSPEPDVLAEARIVAAGTLADRGDLDGAITLLTTAGAAKSLRNPAARHIRQWYALADLYERAGDLPKAVELFARVHQHDPEAYDVAARLASLGGLRSRPRRPPRKASAKKSSPD